MLPAWRAAGDWCIRRAQLHAFARRIETFFGMVRAQARSGSRARFPVVRTSVAHFRGFCRALGNIEWRGDDRLAHLGPFGTVWACGSCLTAFPTRPKASALPTSQIDPRIDTISRAGPPLDCFRLQLTKLSVFRHGRYQLQPKTSKPYEILRESLTCPRLPPPGWFLHA